LLPFTIFTAFLSQIIVRLLITFKLSQHDTLHLPIRLKQYVIRANAIPVGKNMYLVIITGKYERSGKRK